MKNYRPPELTAKWLTTVLKENGFLPQGHVVEIHQDTRPIIGMTADLIFIQANYSKEAPQTLCHNFALKQNKEASHFPEATRNWVRDLITAEVKFYNSFAGRINPDALIPCYGAAYDEQEPMDYYILLADLSDSHYQTEWPLPPTAKECELIVESLARIHGAWWDKKWEIEEVTGLTAIQYMEQGLARVQEHVDPFIEFLGDRISKKRREILKMSVAGHSLFLKRLTDGPLTLVHSDSHFWNFFLPKDSQLESTRIFDWQGYSLGLGVLNLAEFLGQHLYGEMRQRVQEGLLRHYHRILQEMGIRDYTWVNCWEDYRLAAVAQLWVPIVNWQQEMPPQIWWSKLESAFTIFEDLECEQLFD